MDRITSNFMDEFARSSEITNLPKSEQFEVFCAYCIVSQEYEDDFDPTDLCFGGSQDLGIDSAALVVNGHLVRDKEEIADLRTRNNYLHARLILVQSKTSESFSGSVITDLADNLCDFFSESPKLPMNSDVIAFKELVDELYSNSTAFRRGSPDLVVRYVTTGSWTGTEHLAVKLHAASARLNDLSLFEDIDFKCLGAKEIQALYRGAENSVEASFEFPDSVVMPAISGVEQAYIGYVKASEYIKLIEDGAGNIRKSVFFDNVRDFQDYNEVNRGIRDTICDPSKAERFVVLNNGVTVVARELNITRKTFNIRDYQIVNGCQTSHVLFDERDSAGPDLSLPLKVVVTQDEDVASSITAATNRQTQVSDDDLQALEAFQKVLEDYFNAHPIEQRLYYERRSKQYAGASRQTEKTRIITRPQLIKAYAATFLDEPHRAGRYYRELLRIRRADIFREDDNPYAYYASAVALYRLEWCFRNQYLHADLKPARYPFLTGARYLVMGSSPVPSGRKQCEKYCEEFTSVLWDQHEGPEVFNRLRVVVGKATEAVTGDLAKLNRDTVRTQQFTDLIISTASDLHNSP